MSKLQTILNTNIWKRPHQIELRTILIMLNLKGNKLIS